MASTHETVGCAHAETSILSKLEERNLLASVSRKSTRFQAPVSFDRYRYMDKREMRLLAQ